MNKTTNLMRIQERIDTFEVGTEFWVDDRAMR